MPLDRSRRIKAWAIVIGIVILLLSIGAAAATSKRPCDRTIVNGNLDGDTEFRARDVIIYADGMFPGNPMVVRVAGNVDHSDWYHVSLPGIRVIDQLRVFARGGDVGAYFLDGAVLAFYVNMSAASALARVSIYYIPGSATWSNHFELDLDEQTIALVGHVFWNSRVLFRDVDLILVSGQLHTATSTPMPRPPSPTTSAGASGLFDWSNRIAPPEPAPLAAFTVPSSQDTGIYVVHRAPHVDLPGSNRPGSTACSPSSFYIRVYETPVSTRELVVADASFFASVVASPNGTARPAKPGVPLFFEIKNLGALPWMGGRTDLYKDGILAGSDTLPYVSRGGVVRLQMGWALDLKVTRIVTVLPGTITTNYTISNLDVSGFTVEIRDTFFLSTTSFGLFTREGISLVAQVYVAGGASLDLGWARDA